MSEEGAFADVHYRIGAEPVALLIGGEDIAIRIETDAGGAAKAGTEAVCDRAALRRDDGPAAPQRMISLRAGTFPLLPHGAVERVVHVAVAIKDRAISVFVISAGDAPALADGEV